MCIYDGFGAICMVLWFDGIQEKRREFWGQIKGFLGRTSIPFIVLFDCVRNLIRRIPTRINWDKPEKRRQSCRRKY